MYELSDFLSPAPTTAAYLPEYSHPMPEYSTTMLDSFPGNGFDPVREALAVLQSAESGGSSSSSSLPTYLSCRSPMQRSFSSNHRFPSAREFVHSQVEPIRKVFSAGDIQGINGLQHSHHSESPRSHDQCGVDHVARVGRYSAEERRERIERYRSKRNQRNFHKKITYACRKTLADSRPRVRGRFARNDEMGEANETGEMTRAQWDPVSVEDEDDEKVWINFLNAFSMNLIP